MQGRDRVAPLGHWWLSPTHVDVEKAIYRLNYTARPEAEAHKQLMEDICSYWDQQRQHFWGLDPVCLAEPLPMQGDDGMESAMQFMLGDLHELTKACGSACTDDGVHYDPVVYEVVAHAVMHTAAQRAALLNLEPHGDCKPFNVR